jgi:hypothetical protein
MKGYLVTAVVAVVAIAIVCRIAPAKALVLNA